MIFEMKEFCLSLNLISVSDLECYSETQLLFFMIKKINEIINCVNGTYDEIKEQVQKQMKIWLEDGTLANLINKTIFDGLNNKIDNVPVKTPQDYGCKCDGVTDDGDAFIQAMYDCSQHGFILCINKKVIINHDVVYDGFLPLTIIGKNGRFNSLTSDTATIGNLPCDIYLGQGVNFEINKLGSVNFIGVGFGSHSLEYGGNIKMCSFSNMFLACSFHQMNKAIYYTSGAKNWLGENKIALCQFHRCNYAVYSESGSDSEFTDNLIHGSCRHGFWGGCAGWNITGNHFYTQQGNRFEYFNTQISNNYIQEIPIENVGIPTVTLAGSFGCQLNNNRFELVSSEARSVKTSLVKVETRNGGGNIQIRNNSVHGRNMMPITNLAFLQFVAPEGTTTIYDMPIDFGGNNLRCCESVLLGTYPMYNFTCGVEATEAANLIILGGTVTSNTSELINGVNYCKVQFSSFPNYENLAKINNASGFAAIGVLHYTKANGETGNKIMYSDKDWIIKLSNYTELQGGTGTLYIQYQINHRGNTKWSISV